MSLISSTVGLIAQKQQGIAKSSSQSFDLGDNAFSDILEAQMNNTLDNKNNIPSGINIGDYDGTPMTVPVNNSSQFNINKDMTTSEILTFFPSIFSTKPDLTTTETNSIFNFERKLAANSYGKYAKDLVTDLSELVTGTLKSK